MSKEHKGESDPTQAWGPGSAWGFLGVRNVRGYIIIEKNDIWRKVSMSDVKIRNLEPYVLSKLTEEAKKKKISREEYMRILLTQAALMPEVKSIDEKYQNLVHELMGRLKYQNDILERAIEIIEAEK